MTTRLEEIRENSKNNEYDHWSQAPLDASLDIIHLLKLIDEYKSKPHKATTDYLNSTDSEQVRILKLENTRQRKLINLKQIRGDIIFEAAAKLRKIINKQREAFGELKQLYPVPHGHVKSASCTGCRADEIINKALAYDPDKEGE